MLAELGIWKSYVGKFADKVKLVKLSLKGLCYNDVYYHFRQSCGQAINCWPQQIEDRT